MAMEVARGRCRHQSRVSGGTWSGSGEDQTLRSLWKEHTPASSFCSQLSRSVRGHPAALSPGLQGLRGQHRSPRGREVRGVGSSESLPAAPPPLAI